MLKSKSIKTDYWLTRAEGIGLGVTAKDYGVSLGGGDENILKL